MRSEDLFSAIETLDPALLYDARANNPVKRNVIFRISIAAAIVLMLFAGVMIYANFVMPVSSVALESEEAVLLSINARGNVLSVLSERSDFAKVIGKSYPEAIDWIVGKMIEQEELNRDENTLLLITDSGHSENAEKAVQKRFEEHRFSGSIVSVFDEKQTTDVTAVKDILTELLTKDSSFTYDGLRDLSVNDLNLLLKEKEITDENLRILFEPSESGYIGRDEAKRIAMENTALSSYDSVTAELSVYHRQMIYLVTIKSEDRGEAHFIGAFNGAREHIVRASSEAISQSANREVKNGSSSLPDRSDITDNISSLAQSAPVDSEEEKEITPTPTEAPDDRQMESEEVDFAVIPVTMRELSFSAMQPPPSAREAAFGVLFEGHLFEERFGEKQIEAQVVVIQNLSQWNKFLSENNKEFLDRKGNAFENTVTAAYFEQHFLIISSCVFTDTSCYTTIPSIGTTDDAVYIENSLVYGEERSGEYYCRTLSVYGVDRKDVSPDKTMNVY